MCNFNSRVDQNASPASKKMKRTFTWTGLTVMMGQKSKTNQMTEEDWYR
jgi:hypothetical protein